MADEIIWGYQRVADGDACDFCAMLDGAQFRTDDPMPIHPGCGCGVEPVEYTRGAASRKKTVNGGASRNLPKSVDVSDLDSPEVQDALTDYLSVPEELRGAYDSAGLKVKIGNKTLTELGFKPGGRRAYGQVARKWDEVGGVFSPSDGTAYAALRGNGGSVSTVLHEMGHGFYSILERYTAPGKALNVSPRFSYEMSEWHRKLYDGLAPYFQGRKPGSTQGKGELFAESFAEMVKDPALAEKKYGKEYVDWLRQQVAAIQNFPRPIPKAYR